MSRSTPKNPKVMDHFFFPVEDLLERNELRISSDFFVLSHRNVSKEIKKAQKTSTSTSQRELRQSRPRASVAPPSAKRRLRAPSSPRLPRPPVTQLLPLHSPYRWGCFFCFSVYWRIGMLFFFGLGRYYTLPETPEN